MKNEPVKVSLIGIEENHQGLACYQIQFPNLNIPINVNEDLYQKMLHSRQYIFEDEVMQTLEKHLA